MKKNPNKFHPVLSAVGLNLCGVNLGQDMDCTAEEGNRREKELVIAGSSF